MNFRSRLRRAALIFIAALGGSTLPLPAAPGDVEPGFDPDVSVTVYATAVQPDGKIVIGGTINDVGGEPRNGVARIFADGDVDESFDPQANGTVYAVAVQPDGKVLIAGSFDTLQPNGAASTTPRKYIARLNADGTLDASFDPNPDSDVFSIALQPDGKVVFGGQFTTLQPNGAASPTARSGIARVNADGTLDAGFDPNPDQLVWGVALQADGKVLLGGSFTSLQPNGAVSPTTRSRIARVNTDGTLDAVFDPAANADVFCVAVQADGKVLLGGTFVTLQPNGAVSPTFRSRVARVNADGTLDAGFDPNPNERIFSLSTQADGKVLLCGFFTALQPNGASLPTTRNYIARVNGDGTLDGSFDPNADAFVYSAMLQRDGRVLLAGDFNALQPNGAPAPTVRDSVARLANDASAQAITVPGGTAARWTRSGAAPEVESVTFELSTDGGTSWSPLGAATRIGATSDWQLTGLSLPASGSLRARGRTAGGIYNGGSGLIEQVTAFPTPGEVDPLDANIVGGQVFATAVQPDGKTILAGFFTSVLGVPRNHLARLNADGTLDMGFDPNPNGQVLCVAVQADGKVLLGGGFSALQPKGAGAPVFRSFVARVNADGTLDTGFDPKADFIVFSMAVQADGKVLLGGNFNSLQPNGAASPTTRNGIARVNADGTLDAAFDPNADDDVYSVALQADGKVLLGGDFTSLQPNGAASPTTRNSIARVNADGTLDTVFDPNAPGGTVLCVAVQADGKVLLGGQFTALQPNGAPAPTTRNNIARVNADGTLDTAFDPNVNIALFSIAVQADGKVLLGGSFTALQPNGAVSPTTRRNIARVNADGTLDVGFDPNANNSVNSVALQADGKVLLGGVFAQLQPNGAASPTPRNRFARLYNDPPSQTLSVPDATQVLWQRGGAGPELSRVTFELSSDGGATWSLLGAGIRVGVTSNWQLTGLALPASGSLRARGRTGGGYLNGSSGLIEQMVSLGPVPSAVVSTGGTATGGDLPAGATFVSFTAPDIGVAGGRVLADGRRLDAVFNEQGVVLLHGTQMVAVDPDGGSDMGMIAKLMPPTGDAVLATLDRRMGATAENDQVLFTGLLSGTPKAAARKGQAIANLLGFFLKSFVSLDGNGTTTFFSGKIKGPGITETNNTALFGVGATGLRLLARQGMMVNDDEVKTIGTLVGQAGSLAEGRWRGGPDIIGARLTMKKGAQHLYLIPADATGPADWLLIAKSGDDAGPDLPEVKLRSFKLPAHAPGATVFDSLLQQGTGTPPITRKNSRAVFEALGVDTAGPIALRLLAQVAGPAPAQSNIQRFRDALAGLGRSSTVIADATLPGRNGSRTTIFDARQDGVLRSIARLGDVAPGGGRYDRFVSVVKPDGQGYGALVSALLKVAAREGVTPKNRAALFGVDSKGNMIRLLRTGDRIESAGPGSARKPVRSFVALAAAPGSIGAARGYSADGRVNVLVTFNDRTQAVVTIQVP